MSLRETLARADADLAAGRVPVARQRLRGLVSSYPADPAPRRRLAEVYRLYGEPAEAGRWMYLEADRDPAETSAFEERYGVTGRRMRALAWRGPESDAPSDFARDQLATVRITCSEAIGRPVDWSAPPSRAEEYEVERAAERSAERGERPGGWIGTIGGILAAIGCLTAVAATVTIWVIGVIALFD
ncbi:DUF6584 family protein [Streptomyces sp. NPDC058953]|uniref:DUF6584 family protein n=1 Tax=unclassified Streptomyces TaxID=2593676 RepID=UPI0036A08476